MPDQVSIKKLAPGTLVAGRYELLETIGEGGMGVVYRVDDRSDAQTRALKILKDTAEKQPASERRFRREYRALAKLRHPAVVDVFDTGTFEGHLFFVMELVTGHTLRDWGSITPAGTRSEAELRDELDFYLRTIVTVLDALSDVHASGVVHRDLKPQNVMIDEEGSVRIMDFGVALELQAPASETSSNMILGTVGYVSPEEVRGVKLDARADLYSVGAMLYEYITGELPFDDENPILAFTRMLKERPVPPRRLQPFVSQELDDVVLRLLEREPEDRYQSAEEAAFALNLCLESSSGQSTMDASSVALRMRIPTLYSSRLVGHQVGLHLLGRLLEKSRRGQGRMALVLGEAGIGKTRLVQELAVSEERSQITFLHGSCFEREGVFYQPYAEMIGDYVRRVGRTAKRDQLMERLYDADLFPLMREINRESQEAEERPRMAIEEKVRLFEAVARLVADFTRQRPILMHLDDMHYSDELTLEMTRHLARNLKAVPILIVVSLRPDECKRPEAAHVRRFLDDMRREGLLDAEVKLDRLARDEVGELLSSLVRFEPSAELVDSVFHLTDGIPYFVEEVVKTIPSDVRVAGGHAGGELPIPATIAEIVQRQLMSLSADERDVLRDAAHIGTDFEFDLLLQVTGRDEGDLLDLIDEFLRSGLVTEISTSRRDAYRFTHPAVRETLLRQVGERKRRKVHLRIALAMEELYHDRLEKELTQNIEEIARQYRLGGDAEKAFEYGWIAGKKAMERRAFDAGLRHLNGLLELVDAREIRPSHAQLAEMVLDLGTCYERSGRLVEARELYEGQRERIRRSADVGAQVEIGRRLARICAEEGRIDDALVEIETVARQPLDPSVRVGVETEMARLLENRGDHDESMSVLLTTLQLAEMESTPGPMAEALGLLGSIFTARGEHLEAARYLEKALEIARNVTGADSAASSVHRVALLLSLLAENAHQALDSALEIRFYEECLQELDRTRDILGVVAPLSRMGRAYVVLGEMNRGREVLEDALRRCRRFALTRALPLTLEGMSLHSLYRGKLRSARAELLQAYDLAESVGELPVFFRVALSLGQLLTLLQAFNEALVYLRQAMGLAEAKDNTLWKVQVLSAEAELALCADRRGEAHDALDALAALEASFQELITPRHFVPCQLVRGVLLEREGKIEDAEASFGTAFDGLNDVVWPFMLGQCHFRYSQLLRRQGRADEARVQVEAARRIFGWLGNRHYLVACDEEDRLLG